MITINNALETVTEQYNPDYYRRKAHNDFSNSDKCIIGQMTSYPGRSNCSPTAEALRYTEEYSSQSIVADDFKICSIPDFGFDDFRYKQLSPIETARFFAECIGKYAAYIPELRDWKIYDGIKWIDDCEGLRVMSRAKEFAEKILKAIPKPTDTEQLKIQRLRDKGLTEEEIDAMPLNERNEAAGISDTEIESISKENLFINSAYKYYSYFEKRQGRKNLVDDTKDILRKSIEDFDGKPYLFNLRNGTYNLEASCLQPHNPADLLTASAAVSFDPNAKSERFIKFIDDITGGNKEKANYIQKALGYSLKGIKNEECFFLLYGATTRNGKGTLLETMLSVFGDYGKNMDFSTLSKNKNQDGGRATPDLARLKGVRLVKVDEPDRGVFFDEGLIKKLSGGDKITARHLYGNLFEFIPEFSIFITANNKPNVSDTSIFQSDRLKLISFDRHFSENERDTGLKEKLREEHELSGIFNWLLNGYFLYCNCGLKNTSEMNTLLAGYAKDSDEIQQYIDDRLLLDMTLDNKQIESVKSIRNDYTIWCRHLGTHPLSTRTFKEELRKHGVMFKVSHNQDYICGKLKTPFPD